MNENVERKIKRAIQLLQQIDDALGNDICLQAKLSSEDEPLDEFTFWGVADMLSEYLRRNKGRS